MNGPIKYPLAFPEVLGEVARQNAKWGELAHTLVTWSAILSEECGEVSQAALRSVEDGKWVGAMRTELIQVAAVALQVVAAIDRVYPREESGVAHG